ncbi:PIN domain-containing protein [Moorena producens JHB]|uniref:PIN domain-containing protein n=1 Tax=Moorena producens (strain JHB) TaxID=1454205 RepID=A0A1D9FZC0_MOOP1|nr:PIN domain-containing protein [Moorena producens]AOY80717.1 PIN domain-containing protein [Moorena producens JHB]
MIPTFCSQHYSTDKSRFSELLLDSNYNFFICEQVLVELFKRKEKILKASQLREEEIVTIYQILLKRINL